MKSQKRQRKAANGASGSSQLPALKCITKWKKKTKSVLEHPPRAGLFMTGAERSENAGVHHAERLSDGPTPEATCVQY